MTGSVIIAKQTVTSAVTSTSSVASVTFNKYDNFYVRVWSFTNAAGDSTSICSIAFQDCADTTAGTPVWNTLVRQDLISGPLPADGFTIPVEGRQFPALQVGVANNGLRASVQVLSGTSPTVVYDVLRVATA